MASYPSISLFTNTRPESPAKVFAKLKSKVQREMCAKEGGFTGNSPLYAPETRAVNLNPPWKTIHSPWMIDDMKGNQRFDSYSSEAEVLTLSPIKSPTKSPSNPQRSVEEVPHDAEAGNTLRSRHGYTPAKKRHLMESTAIFHPLVNTTRVHTDAPPARDLAASTATYWTPVKKEALENNRAWTTFEEGCAPLETPTMFSPIRKRLRRGDVSDQTKQIKPVSETDTNVGQCGVHLGSSAVKRCSATGGKLMSPAKVFAYMKQRENRREQEEVKKVLSSTSELLDKGRDCLSNDGPGCSADRAEFEVNTSPSVSESADAVTRPRLESTDSHSDTDPAEDVRPPAVSSQPVLLEDPLVLNTPQISIPKKHKALINHNQWPQHTTLPSESVIYLKKWYLRRNSSGLFVGGLHREENIPWNSNIIVERVSTTVLKTVSSRVYILVGKMKFVESEFPRWFLKKFENGFPPNWKELNEKFQSESRQKPRRDRESNRQMRRVMARTSLDSSALKTPIRQSRRNTPQTRVSCPAATSSSTRVSRSGRVIKPPLEYWKGGRVILDAHMNVTIFEGYDTSICLPDVTSKVSTRASLDSAQVPQPCSKGRKQRESTSSNEPPAPLRKAKAPPRKRKPAKVLLDQRPSISPGTSSPEETSVDPQTPSEAPEKPSIRKSQRKTKKPWLGEQKRIVPPCNESSTDNDKILQHQSSDEEFSVKKKKRGTKALGMQGRKFSPSSQSSGGSGQKPRKTAKVPKKNNAAQTKPKQSKYTKKSSPPKPSLKVTQSSKKHKGNKVKTVTSKEEDEDQWSEAELNTLQQAVSSFPKHIIGYWTNVARMVGTHSAEECHNKHMSHGTDQTPVKKNDKTKRNLAKAPKEADLPVISARVGTLRRKQQVRQFLEAMPRDDVEDVFSSAQNKCFEIPSMCPSEECDFTLSDLEPMKTPTSSLYPEAKTPRCLHITPGMMGSPDRMTDDRYVFQLQKRMKKRRFNVYKQAPPKSFTPTPSAKQTTKRCGNTESDTFVVWEMFPDKAGMLSESGEEEDFYFSDHD